MPKGKGKPTEVVIKINCCKRGSRLKTRGSTKHINCWECNAHIFYDRSAGPPGMLYKNDVVFHQWSIISEKQVEEQEDSLPSIDDFIPDDPAY